MCVDTFIRADTIKRVSDRCAEHNAQLSHEQRGELRVEEVDREAA